MKRNAIATIIAVVWSVDSTFLYFFEFSRPAFAPIAATGAICPD